MAINLLSFGGLVGLAGCYLFRFDAVTPITLVPIWFWSLLGLSLAMMQRKANRSRFVWLTCALWLAFPLALGDAPLKFFARSSSTPAPNGRLRIVSLNCSGNIQAAREAAALSPDVLLLQESPGEEQLAELCHEFFGESGSYVRGVDCSIVARGSVAPLTPDRSRDHFFQLAKIDLPSGAKLIVVSLRLRPVPVRGDFWTGEFWRTYRDHRRQQRREVQTVAKAVGGHGDLPMVVGGDFNAPAGDAIFVELPRELRDSFREAGVGWGNTILNDWPVHRIDQIWASGELATVSCQAVATRHSDHRKVVAEFAIHSQ